MLTGTKLVVSSKDRPRAYRRFLVGRIPRLHDGLFKFTLKYRTRNSDWRWVNDESSLTDGELCFQRSELFSDINKYVDGTASSFRVSSVSSSVPHTILWELALPVGAAGEQSSFSKELLGSPTELSRWFSLVRIWSPWLGPRHGKTKFHPFEDSIVCSFLRHDGLHFVILEVSGVDDTLTVFQHDGNGGVTVNARNDGVEAVEAKVIAAAGFSHETALAACMYRARTIAMHQTSAVGEPSKEVEVTCGDRLYQGKAAPADEKQTTMIWGQEWLDGLTYCTWNSLGQNLTEKKILDALDDLDENNIKITSLIIDDNWQTLDNPGQYQDSRGWMEFEANKEGFPQGLAHCVYEARDRHPSINHVAVWHAILGYWGGISPHGELAKKYKTQVVKKASLGRVHAGEMTVVAAEDAPRLYDDFYRFLQGCRVDSIKTDAQFFLDLIDHPADRRNLIRSYQDAWSVSSLKWMATKAISCMSLVPQIIFHSQLPNNRPAICVRNSDDFFPEIPSSHPWHLFTNAYTSLLTTYLNALPDWDMFQTHHEYSSFHAAARCVSGGPIYITDEPGKHDIGLIRAMTAQTNRDSTVILRPSTVGKTVPSGVYTAYEEERFLKIGTYNGGKFTGAGILGVFNVSERALAELVRLDEFPGVESGQKYIVRAHSTSEIGMPMTTSDELPLVSLFLPVKGWEILTAYPLVRLGGMEIAPLGLLGKMTSVAAIVESNVALAPHNKVNISVQLKTNYN